MRFMLSFFEKDKLKTTEKEREDTIRNKHIIIIGAVITSRDNEVRKEKDKRSCTITVKGYYLFVQISHLTLSND